MPLNLSPVPQPLRDAAYNNGAAAPTGAAVFARFAGKSNSIRSRFSGTMDLPYGLRERNRIDLFPGSTADAPCLVYLHGGYWQLNSREMFAVLGEGVAARGWSVAIPGYTLAPEASLTEIAGEVGDAIDWIAVNAIRHGISGPLVVAGSSAGGMLAALALSHSAGLAGFAISGVFELAPLRGTYLDAKLKLTDSEIADLSPLRRPVVKKPLTCAYGANELPDIVANSVGFHALRLQAGAAGQLLKVHGCDHFSILTELRRPDSSLTGALLNLL